LDDIGGIEIIDGRDAGMQGCRDAGMQGCINLKLQTT
jgi:hypothetical protein